jgi:LysR family carnitine catabolism transcriptional activator
MLGLEFICVKSNKSKYNLKNMNYLNPRHLHAFVCVVDRGSMVKAAGELHLGQPALSQAIAKLEEVTGFRLFDRTTRSLSLTPAGKVFYDNARSVLEQNQRMLADIQQWAHAQQGSISLMSIPSVAQCLLPSTVRDFSLSHPDVKLQVHDLPDRQLSGQIRIGQGDIAIQTKGFEDEHCRSLPLLNDPLRWVGIGSHPLASKKNINPSDWTNETLIVLRKGSVFREMMEPLLRDQLSGVKTIEVEQQSTLLSMVSCGLGVALLPALCCPTSSKIIHRSWQSGSIARSILLTRPAGRALMPAPREFVRFMLDQLAQGLITVPEGVKRNTLRTVAINAFLEER